MVWVEEVVSKNKIKYLENKIKKWGKSFTRVQNLVKYMFHTGGIVGIINWPVQHARNIF